MGVYEVLVIVAFAVDFFSSFFESERIRISISHSTSASFSMMSCTYVMNHVFIYILLLLFEEGKGKTNRKVAAIENTHRRQYRNRKQQNKFFS